MNLRAEGRAPQTDPRLTPASASAEIPAGRGPTRPTLDTAPRGGAITVHTNMSLKKAFFTRRTRTLSSGTAHAVD